MKGDAEIRLAGMSAGSVRYLRKMIQVSIDAFIMIWLSRVRPFTMYEFARTLVCRSLLILRMKYFWALKLRTIFVTNSLSGIV